MTLISTGTWDRLVKDEPVTALAASYPKLLPVDYQPTGNQRKDMIGFAKTQIGYDEGRNNNTYFGNWFGLNYSPWCAIFVSWCAAKSGVSKSVLPRQANADRSWAKKQKVYHKSQQWGGNYKPKRGDLIYFSWSVRDWADHIGMVWKTKTKNGKTYVYTIEGNKRDQVVKGEYELSNKYILGYASPKYKTDGEVKEDAGYTLKYRDGLSKTSDAEDAAVNPKVRGTFGKDLTLSSKKYTRKGYKYSSWQIYRINENGQKIFLCRDKAKDKKEGWYQSGSTPGDYQRVKIKTGKALKIKDPVDGTIYAKPVWKKKKQKQKQKTAVTDPFKVKVTLTNGMNIRTGPDLTYDIAGRAGHGKTMTISKVKKGWGKIKGTSNWVMLKYTRITSGYTVKVTTKNLNLRSGPGTNYKAKGKIKPGKYAISKIDGSWGKVKAKGYWINLDYTTRVK